MDKDVFYFAENNERQEENETKNSFKPSPKKRIGRRKNTNNNNTNSFVYNQNITTMNTQSNDKGFSFQGIFENNRFPKDDEHLGLEENKIEQPQEEKIDFKDFQKKFCQDFSILNLKDKDIQEKIASCLMSFNFELAARHLLELNFENFDYNFENYDHIKSHLNNKDFMGFHFLYYCIIYGVNPDFIRKSLKFDASVLREKYNPPLILKIIQNFNHNTFEILGKYFYFIFISFFSLSFYIFLFYFVFIFFYFILFLFLYIFILFCFFIIIFLQFFILFNIFYG